ncbi:antibiotic biosynthesis monooxygenase [Halocella sp. SP3-1]|uniref:antibiotic biosynthesis monooxygenase n=1 Tax=Halocella sp. SP3-1 TaxID=2382161 RepID=UPI000F760604|nr:antibiotic biosynthesis monooxygenase [Halocella sp. SP3-1]AZO95323.1 antibiotic biosynthesis monooxygenase [Halocella sp. SP3-1]
MLAYVVEVYVKEKHIEGFKKATIENHYNTIKEIGNYRFDVLQSKEELGHFTLYEVYESEDAVSAHKETPHYLKWRETVAEWMAAPRKGIKYDVITPKDAGQ